MGPLAPRITTLAGGPLDWLADDLNPQWEALAEQLAARINPRNAEPAPLHNDACQLRWRAFLLTRAIGDGQILPLDRSGSLARESPRPVVTHAHRRRATAASPGRSANTYSTRSIPLRQARAASSKPFGPQ